MFKRILVPIDGSATSQRGLDEAIKLAQDQRATLCLLHVVDERVLTQAIDAGAVAIDSMLESMHDSGKKILAQAEAKVRKRRLRSQSVLIDNLVRSVADVIVAQAKKWRADVIVIGTHGRRGVSRLVMGSDAEGVVREATVPVLLVKAAARKRR
jgi:nucleotide-binding universal stress UspA family protein